MKASMAARSCRTEVKLAPSRVLRARIEHQISTWLSQLAWVGVKWKWTCLCRVSPIALGLVGLEIVEHDVDLAVGIIGDHVVHEVEELGAPPALGVLGFDLAGGDLERREQGRGPAAFVVVGKAGERTAVGQLEVTLRALERLDRRLLVDREHDRVLRRRQVEPDDVGGLDGELGIGGAAPGFASRKIDPLHPQEPPDVLVADVAEVVGDQRRGPTGNPTGGGRSSTARMR